VIGSLILGLISGSLIWQQTDEHLTHCRIIDQRRRRPAPGLSSQRSQIKPLTSEQIALGKKPYLGPKRKRKVKIPKRHQPT